jgi:disulfide bond formation protein DsbB
MGRKFMVSLSPKTGFNRRLTQINADKKQAKPFRMVSVYLSREICFMWKILNGRMGYFLGFLASFGLVGLALWIQQEYSLDPCPLCISQRMAFMALGGLFLLAALHNPTGRWRIVHGVLQVAATVVGALIASRHIWIQAHPEEVMEECGAGFDFMVENFPASQTIQLIFNGSGECAAIDWTLFGLTIPQLSLIAFIGMAIYALILAAKK